MKKNFFLLLLLTSFLVNWHQFHDPLIELTPKTASAQRLIPINKCQTLWLELLPGIGPHKSQLIASKRPHHKLDDLLQIKGIGRKNLLIWKHHLDFK